MVPQQQHGQAQQEGAARQAQGEAAAVVKRLEPG